MFYICFRSVFWHTDVLDYVLDIIIHIHKEFRTLLTELLTVPEKRYVLVNYHRTEVHQEGGGHFSPVVALDPVQDMVLIAGETLYIKLTLYSSALHCADWTCCGIHNRSFDTYITAVVACKYVGCGSVCCAVLCCVADVTRYKYAPTWVSVADLYASVNTTDNTSGKSRGLMLMS